MLAGRLSYHYERKRVCVIIGLHKPVSVFLGGKRRMKSVEYTKRERIRSNLHIDPTAGCGDDFAEWYAEALWLEEMRMKNHAEILSRVLLALFGQRQSL